MSKCIYKDIADSLDKEALEEYYQTHLPKDMCKEFGFDQIYFYRIFDYLGIKRRNASENSKIQGKYYITEEHRKNQSIAQKKRYANETPEQKAKRIENISKAEKGKKKSKEHCEAISRGTKKYLSEHGPWNKGLKGVQSWIPGQKERYLATLKANGWFNTSKPEEELYKELCDRYGIDDVEHPYNDDPRYPFSCDFYIKSEDLFIELNRFWHHGPHPFDETNEEDIKLLETWKSKSDGSNQYSEAIKTWTVRDPLKIKTAKENNLNYKMIY